MTGTNRHVLGPGPHLSPERLLELGLGEAPAARETMHLASCPACTGVIEKDFYLWANLRACVAPQPPAGFAQAALQRFRRVHAAKPASTTQIALWACALAALVGVLAFTFIHFAPAALVSVLVGLPRWPGSVAAIVRVGRLMIGVLPQIALAAGFLLVTVVVALRRLSSPGWVATK